MSKKIGVVLAVDGEKEFTQALSNARSETSRLKADASLLTQQNKENANSLDYLSQKQKNLTAQKSAYKKVLEAATAGQKNAEKSLNKQREAVAKLETQLSQAKSKLEQMEKAGDNSSKSYQEQEKNVESLEKALEKQKNNLQTAERREKAWQTKITQTNVNLEKNTQATKTNTQYLEEAKASRDKCATSIDKYGKAVKVVTEEQLKLSDEEKRHTATIEKMVDVAGDAAIKVGEAAVDAIKKVVELGSSFEAAMSSVKAITGATGSEFEDLEQTAIDLGASTSFSSQEVADAMTEMAKAGWSTQEIIDGMGGVLDATAASGEELGTVSTIVADAITGFGLAASDSAKVADLMTQAANSGTIGVSDLGESYKYVSPLAQSMGLSIEDVTTALSAMSMAGIKGSQAGTALRTVLTNMAKPTDDVEAAMEQLGISITNEDGSFKSLNEIVGVMRNSFSGLTDDQKTYYATTIAGKEGMSGLLSILNLTEEEYDDLSDSMNNCSGVAEETAEVMQDNLQSKAEQLGGAFESLAIKAYDAIDGPLTGVVEGITSVVEGVTDAIFPARTELEEFIDDIKSSNEEVQGVLDSRSGVWDTAEADAAKLDAYRDALLEASNTEADSEFQKYKLQSIVQELSSDIPELAAAFDEETGSINLSEDAISALIDKQEAYLLQQAALEATKDSFDAVFEAEVNAAKAADAVTEAQEEFNSAMAEFANGTGGLEAHEDEIKKLENTLLDAQKTQEDCNATVDDANEQYAEMEKAVESASEKIGQSEDALAGCEDELASVSDSAEETSDAVSDMSDEAADAAEEAQEAFSEMQDSISDSISDSIDMFEEFSGGTEVTAEEVIKNLNSQIKGVGDWADNMKRLAGEAGNGISQELYDKLAEMGPESANLVQMLVEELDGKTGNFEIICEKWSQALELSNESEILAGYTSVGEGISQAASEGTESAVDTLEKAKADYQSSGQEAADAYTQAVESEKSEAASAASTIAEAATSAAESYEKKFRTIGFNMAVGMAAGIRAGKSLAVSAAASMASDALTAAKNKLQIQSPSKVFRKQVGQQVAKGFAFGISDKKSLAGKAAEEMSGEVYSKATAWLTKYKKAHKTSLEDEKYYWQQIKKHLKKGTEEYEKAQAKIEKISKKQLYAEISDNFGVSKTTTSGSGKNKKTTKKDAETYYSEILSAAEQYLDNYEVLHDMSLANEKKYWQKVTKQLKKGTQAWYDAKAKVKELTEDIAEEKEKANDQIISDAEDYINKQQILGKMSEKQELTYWKKIIKQVKKGSDAWYEAKEKINELTEDIAEAKEEAYDQIISDAEDYIRKQQILGKMSEEQELAYWQKIIKQVKKGSDAWYDAKEKINELKESIAEAAEEEAESQAEAAQEKLETLASVQESILSKYKTYFDVSAKAEMQYWDKARKQFAEGTDERIEADQKYLDAREEYYSELEDLDNQYAEDCEEINEDLKSSIEDLEDAYEDAVSSRKSEILSSMSLFEAWDATGYTGETLIYNLKTQVAGLKLWEEQLEELGEKGIASELMEELKAMGPDAAANIYSLNQMTAEELEEYNQLWLEKNELAYQQAVEENEDLREETTEEINQLKKEATASLNELTATYREELAELNEEMSAGLTKLVSNASQIGEDSVSALVWALASTDTKQKLSSAGSSAGTTAAAGLQSLVQSAKDTGNEAANALTGALLSGTSGYSKDLAVIVDTIVSGLSDLPTKGKNLGKNTAEGILDGLQDGIKNGATSKYCKNVVSLITDGLKIAAQIHSPSRLFKREIGEPMEAGILEGMEEDAAGAEETARSVVNRLLESARDEMGSGELPLDLSYSYSGIDRLNRLTESAPQTVQNFSLSGDGIVNEMRQMVEEVRTMAENMQNLNVILYPDTVAGTLQPYISREDAAASVRRTRGRL